MGMVNTQSDQIGAELLGGIFTRSYGRVWKQNIDDEEMARLAVVGIGPLGARQVQVLTRNHPDLSCHEIRFDGQAGGVAETKAILALVQSSDFLFIVSGFDDSRCEVIFKVVADSAREAGVPVIGVAPDNQRYISVLPFVTSMWPVSGRSFGGDLVSVTLSLKGRDEWAEFALMHLVSTLANILTHKGLIGIDYDDVIDTLKSGPIGRLAVGVASEQVSISDASLVALGLLSDQGAAISTARGVIAYLTGSSTQLAGKEFDAASQIIYQSVGEGMGVIVGMQLMEASRSNVMVTLLAVCNTEGDDPCAAGTRTVR